MRISEVLALSVRRLAERAAENAQGEAEWTLSVLLGVTRTQLYLRSTEVFPSDLLPRLEEIIAARLQSHPLQYLLGYTEFYGRRFRCDPRALIPRPETEILVETTLSYLDTVFPARAGCNPLVWDVGTGSGNVAVTLAAERPDLRVLATDVAIDALLLAKENAKLNRVDRQVSFACGSLCSPITEGRRFAAVCSNPPYVSALARETLAPEVRNFEPANALFAGDDGLSYLRPLIARGANYLMPGGLLALEIGFDHAEVVRTLLSNHGAYRAVKLTKDLAGHLRVACAVRI